MSLVPSTLRAGLRPHPLRDGIARCLQRTNPVQIGNYVLTEDRSEDVLVRGKSDTLAMETCLAADFFVRPRCNSRHRNTDECPNCHTNWIVITVALLISQMRAAVGNTTYHCSIAVRPKVVFPSVQRYTTKWCHQEGRVVGAQVTTETHHKVDTALM